LACAERVKLATGHRIWQRWLAAAGPWQNFLVCPALLSPELEALPTIRPRTHPHAAPFARAIQPLLEPGDTLCVLDLEPSLGVQIAARLAAHAHPVLILPRWPYPEALLPSEELVASLCAGARLLPPPRRLTSVVLVLDAERSQPMPDRASSDPRADNRHALPVFDLPNLATLRTRGIQRVHRVRAA
jgi:hypothetical protein